MLEKINNPKIIYFGPLSLTDCDFPLIRSLQMKGIDVVYYIPISLYSRKGGLFNIKNAPRKDGIYNATEIADFRIYRGYINLDNIYIINDTNKHQKLISSRILWLKVFHHMKRQNADVVHFSWYPSGLSKILYRLDIPKVLTVHDPIRHSSNTNLNEELTREDAFKRSDRLVLLNRVQTKEFKSKYSVSDSKLSFSKLGSYETIRFQPHVDLPYEFKYILFFGQVSGYKGIDYLIKAVRKLHALLPELHLIIAGGGKMYFDFEQYKNLEYIHLKNQFIDLPELASLIQNSAFTVCPYTDATQSGVVQTSLSLEKPVVVTNVGNLPVSVGNGKYGMIVPSKDIDALASAIGKLWNNQALLSQYKDNIHKQWNKEMDWGPISDTYISIYRNTIDNYHSKNSILQD